MNRLTIRLAAGLGIALAASTTVAAQDEAERETRAVEAAGLSLEVPTDWEVKPPSSRMRALEIGVGPAEGDDEPAELVVYAFPGGAGTVDANVQRWQQQFIGEDGQPPEIETETIQAKGGAEVTFVETAGRFVAAVRPGSPQRQDKANYRLLGAILPTQRVGYFVKMVGPDATMTQARPAFKQMVESMTVEEN